MNNICLLFFFSCSVLHAQQIKKPTLDWFEPDETDAFIYGIITIVDAMMKSTNTTFIKNSIESINSAKKYLSPKLNVEDKLYVLPVTKV